MVATSPSWEYTYSVVPGGTEKLGEAVPFGDVLPLPFDSPSVQAAASRAERVTSSTTRPVVFSTSRGMIRDRVTKGPTE